MIHRNLFKDTILAVLRHALSSVGGVLVTSGYLTSTEAATIVGAVLTIAGVGWSIYERNQQAQEDNSRRLFDPSGGK